ncbi:MAG: PD40 domain-containing protein, partial [Deltaproteobacteria bacterium]|nr:PD40 domain-containing protein [Deltaproteobacteria bacterium]
MTLARAALRTLADRLVHALGHAQVSLLAIALLALPAQAAPDPRYDWQTLDTPHFEVHYSQGNYKLALRFAQLAEEAHRRLVPLLDHTPRERTQIVLNDDTDDANGSATPLYYNEIHAYAPPPDARSTLSDFDDWAWELISHEYTHILHLDTVGGIPEVANQLFGKLWIPNGAQPNWFIEGLAVLSESGVSSAGRIRSSLESMLVRTELLSGTFPRLDQISNPILQFPRGNIPYTVGARFLAWINDHYGPGALRDLSHDYGARFIPLGMNLSAGHVLGKTYVELFEEYKANELAKARAVSAEVRAGGETKVELLTRLGEYVESPRWSRDGTRLFYSSQGPDRKAELRVLPVGACCEPGKKLAGQTAPGDERLTTGFSEMRLAVTPEGALVYARPEVFQEFVTLSDLYRFEPVTGDSTRLTRGLRASEPEVARDGSIAFVQRLAGGRTAISLLDAHATEGAEPTILYEDPERGPVGSPRFSPDGNLIAFIDHGHAAWSLRLIGRDGAGFTELTSDRAIVRDPSWSSDGRYVLFSSDRSGVYDLYALRLADRALLRITRVVTGAFEPELSPDQTQLAFIHYGPRGYDLARIAVDLDALQPAGRALADSERPEPFQRPADELFPARPYNPLPTLLPKWWLPYAGVDAIGSTIGAFSSGTDSVGRHEWSATAWVGVDSKEPGWTLNYTNHTLYPDLTLSFSRDLVVPAGLPYNAERQLFTAAYLSVPWSSYARAFSLTAGYELLHLARDVDPFHRAPPDGFQADLYLGFSYTDAFRFARSISTEEGQRFTLNFRVADPALGSNFSFWQASAAYARYFALPWTWSGKPLHHVLAVRLSGGLSQGDLSERHLFSLGGFQQTDLIQAVVNPTAAPSRVLRGFMGGAFGGEEYGLATVEYRFPFADIEAGAWTLPVFLRRLHFAVFSDVGDAFTFSRHDAQLNVGVGGELRAEVVLGWYLPTDLRVGCAQGVTNSPYA